MSCRTPLWLLFALICSASVLAAQPSVDFSAAQRLRLGITTIAATPATALPLAVLPATLVPPPGARVAVTPPFAGVVRQGLAGVGDSVRRGQPLATVFSREVLETGAALNAARARLAVAASASRRADLLVHEGIAAGARGEEARAALAEARAEVDGKARMLGNADPATGLYTLRASIAGRISSASIQTGSGIDTMTAPFVIDTGRLGIEAQLPARLIGQVRPGMAIRLPDGTTGTITSVGASLDPQTRSALLKARIPAALGLIAGSSTRVEVLGPAVPGTVSVPSGAITRLGPRTVVFAENRTGFTPTSIRINGSGGGRTTIIGIAPGTRIAVTGISELKALAQAN